MAKAKHILKTIFRGKVLLAMVALLLVPLIPAMASGVVNEHVTQEVCLENSKDNAEAPPSYPGSPTESETGGENFDSQDYFHYDKQTILLFDHFAFPLKFEYHFSLADSVHSVPLPPPRRS